MYQSLYLKMFYPVIMEQDELKTDLYNK